MKERNNIYNNDNIYIYPIYYYIMSYKSKTGSEKRWKWKTKKREKWKER